MNVSTTAEGKFEINRSEIRPCPVCGFPIGVVAGSKEAICTNCGYKDPCCD